jgi:hypothetical protein
LNIAESIYELIAPLLLFQTTQVLNFALALAGRTPESNRSTEEQQHRHLLAYKGRGIALVGAILIFVVPTWAVFGVRQSISHYDSATTPVTLAESAVFVP